MMKRILCFGDSNTHGTAPMRDAADVVRFDAATRWPGVLQQALGAEVEIVPQRRQHREGGQRRARLEVDVGRSGGGGRNNQRSQRISHSMFTIFDKLND